MNILSKLHKTAALYDHELPALPTQAPAPQGHALASYIDHTLLKPEATHEQIRILCDEAAEHRFASVCVNPVHVPQVARTLAGSPVAVCTVIGFPLGANLPEIKALEALAAIHGGAQEVDIVINVGALKSGAVGMVLNDLLAVIQVAHNAGALVKVILETALLTRLEKITACLLCKEAGAEFVKTSTGFSSGGATTEDVELMRRVVGSRMGVKASGGVRSFADCMAMIQAGANRIGTSSGVKIMQEALR